MAYICALNASYAYYAILFPDSECKKVAKTASENGSDSTKRLLQVIVALLLRPETKDKMSLKQQIEILDDLGLRPAEMADILNRSNIHISKELSGIRKGRKKD